MLVYIQVTAADVLNGQRRNCASCPIALAINRVLKPEYRASLEKKTISLDYGRRAIPQQIGIYPAGLVEKVNCYDEAGEMKPFVFKMHIIDRLIAGI